MQVTINIEKGVDMDGDPIQGTELMTISRQGDDLFIEREEESFHIPADVLRGVLGIVAY